MATGAGETALSEGYMNARVRRALTMRSFAAEYLGNFTSGRCLVGGLWKQGSWHVQL